MQHQFYAPWPGAPQGGQAPKQDKPPGVDDDEEEVGEIAPSPGWQQASAERQPPQLQQQQYAQQQQYVAQQVLNRALIAPQ